MAGESYIADKTTSAFAGVAPRSQTPTGNVLQVQIGPGDVISYVPVVIEFDHHQIHEGETHRGQDIQAALGVTTVKYGITVPVFANSIQGPHMVIGVDIYNGTALVKIYEAATFTGGSAVTTYNRNRNVATDAGTTIKTGVTSTNGTLIDSFYAGAGTKATASNRAALEWVLKSNTIYRVDVTGQLDTTAAIVSFDYYEDLGV